MNRIFIFIFLFISSISWAQSRIVKDFKAVSDSLSVIMLERTEVKTVLKIQNIMKRGSQLDFYFSNTLSDYPWRDGDYNFFIKELKALFPGSYKKYSLGEIYTNRLAFKKLITETLHKSGQVQDFEYSQKKPSGTSLVKNLNSPLSYDKGLNNRHIAIWQSHGRYYAHNGDMWQWQRPTLFQTIEDLFTQSYVLPYIVPMLENAGAYVILPRERDYNTFEQIIDNDPSFVREEKNVRTNGIYHEKGKWAEVPHGFADTAQIYRGVENPFTLGTSRKSEVTTSDKESKLSTAKWSIKVDKKGEYAVYVSYQSLENSTDAAKYTIKHLGGETNFVVNQKLGSGMWIYLGSFEFSPQVESYVTLSNKYPYSEQPKGSLVISADAVKIGGGMGNIARGLSKDCSETSQLPRFCEGARYWMQWSGVDSTVFSQNKFKDDYRDDFMSRGAWVTSLSAGSRVNPKGKGKNIPIDLSFGLHSDAGITPNDSTIGTLSIYTLWADGSVKLPNGEHRLTSRRYADLVQSQLLNDLRHQCDTIWQRRQLWDRSYSESRTPATPAMILEMLSHQNFADMKYGLDPRFKFIASRAIYKGILKYLSERYETPYTVQPLPIESIATKLVHGTDGTVHTELSWKEKLDPLEPTAKPKGYVLYTRIDDGGFDNGKRVYFNEKNGRLVTSIPVQKGKIYSYKIRAYNDGGVSFPSEIVSVGIPENSTNMKIQDSLVVIVNNFDRVSGPMYFDTPSYAGFDNYKDSGVPYVDDYSYIGPMYEFRRNSKYLNNTHPGFGASHSNYIGKKVAGNTFDYVYKHGKLILESGHPFTSMSNEAFSTSDDLSTDAWTVDLICGKQVSTNLGNIDSIPDFQVFTAELQSQITKLSSEGTNFIISGSYIGTDIWDSVYPVKKDSIHTVNSIKFANNILGYSWAGTSASMSGEIKSINKDFKLDSFSIYNQINPSMYSVESPDGIRPLNGGKTIFRYMDTGVSAGTYYESKTNKVISLGFPLESIKEEDVMSSIINSILKIFK